MEEHLKHLALLAYEYFWPAEDEYFLNSRCSKEIRRAGLKKKITGLVMHDRVITQDRRFY